MENETQKITDIVEMSEKGYPREQYILGCFYPLCETK